MKTRRSNISSMILLGSTVLLVGWLSMNLITGRDSMEGLASQVPVLKPLMASAACMMLLLHALLLRKSKT